MTANKIYLRDIRLINKNPSENYWCRLPFYRELNSGKAISFNTPVTFFVGENGSGKSTLIEAIAVAMGYNAEGGSKNFNFSTKNTALYLMFCSLFYLAVLVINRVGKTVSLLIGVGVCSIILLVIALFQFVFSDELVRNIGEFMMKAMGFMSDGTTNLFFPILSFLVIGVAFGIGSYAVIRRTELR